MTANEFAKCMREVPQYVAVFTVTRVPDWATQYGVQNGDQVYWDTSAGSFCHLRKGMFIGLTVSYVKFLAYVDYKSLWNKERDYAVL